VFVIVTDEIRIPMRKVEDCYDIYDYQEEKDLKNATVFYGNLCRV
jgi:hypothetical protein